MLQIDKRILSLSEAVCSILHGDIVPKLYDLDIQAAGPDTAWQPGVKPVNIKLKKQVRHRGSPLAKPNGAPVSNFALQKPEGVNTADWVEEHINSKRGVVAAIPGNPCVAISKEVACGNADYWLGAFVNNPELFNEKKTHRSSFNNRLVYEANMLATGVPAFLPEGDAFGLRAMDTDAFIDAGITVTLRKQPYASFDEPVKFEDPVKRVSSCAKELDYMLEMAEKDIAPCVLATFFTYMPDKDETSVDWGEKPLAAVPVIQASSGRMTALVTVTQISTFSLADLMKSITTAPVKSKRDHLVGVLKSTCGPVFEAVRKLTTDSNGHAMVKLNMDPESIVFCPKLVASEDRWKLEGTGFMPVSTDYLDGVPKVTDFNSVFTTRVRSSSYSAETSFVMHSMLLVAFAKARFGGFVSDILWQHLLSPDDPSAFVCDAKSMQSKPTNASAFLAVLAANSDMRENTDSSKALSDTVSDMDDAIRLGIVSSDGSLSMPSERVMFNKLVSVVTGSTFPDTRLFERSIESDDIEQLHVRALEGVKKMRVDRLRHNAVALRLRG